MRMPTARRTPWALAVATPISVEISWLGRPLRGAVRVVDWIVSLSHKSETGSVAGYHPNDPIAIIALVTTATGSLLQDCRFPVSSVGAGRIRGRTYDDYWIYVRHGESRCMDDAVRSSCHCLLFATSGFQW